MKQKTYVSLFVAAVTAASEISFGALPAEMPEFKPKAELNPVVGETHTSGIKIESDIFYTGKPLADGKNQYILLCRNYNSELSRWTTLDPSGYPDGANAYLFVCNSATSSFDPDGLKKETILTDDPLNWASFKVKFTVKAEWDEPVSLVANTTGLQGGISSVDMGTNLKIGNDTATGAKASFSGPVVSIQNITTIPDQNNAAHKTYQFDVDIAVNTGFQWANPTSNSQEKSVTASGANGGASFADVNVQNATSVSTTLNWTHTSYTIEVYE